MTLITKRKRLIKQIDHIKNEQFLDKLNAMIEEELLKSNIMQYVSPMRKSTNIEDLLKNYRPPDLSKVVGIIPNDQPLEEVLKMLD